MCITFLTTILNFLRYFFSKFFQILLLVSLWCFFLHFVSRKGWTGYTLYFFVWQGIWIILLFLQVCCKYFYRWQSVSFFPIFGMERGEQMYSLHILFRFSNFKTNLLTNLHFFSQSCFKYTFHPPIPKQRHFIAIFLIFSSVWWEVT